MNKRENLFRFEFERAVQASKLDPKIRHLLITMASLADGHTGVGFQSQKRSPTQWATCQSTFKSYSRNSPN